MFVLITNAKLLSTISDKFHSVQTESLSQESPCITSCEHSKQMRLHTVNLQNVKPIIFYELFNPHKRHQFFKPVKLPDSPILCTQAT